MSPLPVRRVTVMVVDDSVPVRRRICELLVTEASAHIVAEAASAREALVAFERFRPEAVVLDIGLPDGSGLEVLRHIKQVAPLCFAIVLTQFDEPVFGELARTLGADNLFHKSNEFERVADAIRALSRE